MSGYSKLPEDYPVDACSAEAARRSRKLGRPYSYGQLIAETTLEERERLAEDYKLGFRANRRGGTKSAFLERAGDAEAEEREKREQDRCG